MHARAPPPAAQPAIDRLLRPSKHCRALFCAGTKSRSPNECAGIYAETLSEMPELKVYRISKPSKKHPYYCMCVTGAVQFAYSTLEANGTDTCPGNAPDLALFCVYFKGGKVSLGAEGGASRAPINLTKNCLPLHPRQ